MTKNTQEMIGISSPRIYGRYKILLLCLAVYALVVLTKLWHSAEIGQALLLPAPADHLEHYRRTRRLEDYLDNIQILIEPSHTPCDGPERVPLLVLVASAPGRLDRRDVIRGTWAKRQPTYFVLGTEPQGIDGSFADIYLEAKEHGDMIVFDLVDHYQNLTLKTALMLQWTLRRCPQTEFLFKTDDDVFVNPWMLEEVLQDNEDYKLVGYMKNNSRLHRDAYNKWFSPRWLRFEDHLPEYLSGTGYLINGEYIEKILKAAKKVPLLNLEDVYFTYLVAKENLGFNLKHDRRLSPYKPLISTPCSYVGLASIHSLSPDEIYAAWTKLLKVVNNNQTCDNYKFLYSDWLLY
ncbi:beta-1,3-galactosyltransferase 5-like [Plodia interpunctella]|uniref:beta-1,3-galactosyltransferase 5-like n=1 Tax=Plodia interpunctella TaxID=58824 RepID=UPI002368C14A|nr:beta-1,3-galactosyltransferase 5-like [Plodia interpunctella]XP_053618126.1 beta-1,3-galactosyltransferase 5-like [Plodia interpunctella]XP_053618128.1 beta-1,3-galactosyltransferase 5-like [Plodia interpunctella]XP_053618129.1 beta-1,3-galactosyltransferase 5-like [Plodia interpunctella]